ncbi:hypothetical protein [Psychrosphaera aestuarii]|uniref:hypothetical protein n=1 Tax=Psychrosphaera aestuarii TaxID=1266052 RepID=UPI001B32EE2D|nr:hypothetical protein [Psychrosphaera aestuarii]
MTKNDLCDNLNSRTATNTKLLAKWTGLWLLSLAFVSFGPKFIWDYNLALTSAVIIVNLMFGFKMIWANKVHLEGLDEMQQRIMLEAMAISLGTTMVCGAVYGLLEAVKVISFEPNASGLLFVMGISYMVGMLISRKRYL